MSYKRISVEDADDLIKDQEVTLLDIRDSRSFMQAHIENAINVSDSNVEEIIKVKDKSKPLIIYCYHGNSSQNAAEYFYNMGFKETFSVDGGFEEWKFKL